MKPLAILLLLTSSFICKGNDSTKIVTCDSTIRAYHQGYRLRGHDQYGCVYEWTEITRGLHNFPFHYYENKIFEFLPSRTKRNRHNHFKLLK